MVLLVIFKFLLIYQQSVFKCLSTTSQNEQHLTWHIFVRIRHHIQRHVATNLATLFPDEHHRESGEN